MGLGFKVSLDFNPTTTLDPQNVGTPQAVSGRGAKTERAVLLNNINKIARQGPGLGFGVGSRGFGV